MTNERMLELLRQAERSLGSDKCDAIKVADALQSVADELYGEFLPETDRAKMLLDKAHEYTTGLLAEL